MIRKILFILGPILLLVGAVVAIKALQIGDLIAMGENFEMPPETVSMALVSKRSIVPFIASVGSVEAERGVVVTTEVAGKIMTILFDSGETVAEGKELIQLDSTVEEAQMRAAESARALAKVNLDRSRELRKTSVVAQSELDLNEAQYKDAQARVDELAAALRKRTIRAPFAGTLGIRQVQLGEYLHPGDPVVALQDADPVFVNFSLPQQAIPRLRAGWTVQAITDALPERVFEGRLTTIEPAVDASMRTVNLQATFANPGGLLRAGMFVNVKVLEPAAVEKLMVPATAVVFAPYGDSIFLVRESEGKKSPQLVAEQKFIRLGERQGDFVAVEEGLAEGDRIVAVGGFKLRNGSPVVDAGESGLPFSTSPKPQEK